MELHDTAAEVPFEAKIDARFPYSDEALSSALITEARRISLNAVFCVLDEICRPPNSSGVTKDRQLALLDEWSSGFEHPLKASLIRCAERLIDGETVPWREAVAIIETVGHFEAQRGALSVAYFSGDSDSFEGNSALELAQRRVRDVWNASGV